MLYFTPVVLTMLFVLPAAAGAAAAAASAAGGAAAGGAAAGGAGRGQRAGAVHPVAAVHNAARAAAHHGRPGDDRGEQLDTQPPLPPLLPLAQLVLCLVLCLASLRGAQERRAPGSDCGAEALPFSNMALRG